jgi:uncharacterized membrane protein HdeD (DUF308 family)
MEDRISMPTCPMAETCKGMMEKPSTSLWMIVPGLVFVVLGIAIILYPQILAWLVSLALIVVGLAMLAMVSFMRRMGKRVQKPHG